MRYMWAWRAGLNIFVGAFFVVICLVGAVVIAREGLTSYSDLFDVYHYFFGFVLLFIGTLLIYMRVEVGIGFLGIGIFSVGFVHDYVMSPFIVGLMLLFYARNREWWWLCAQAIAGGIQGIVFVWFHSPQFYLCEVVGLLIGSAFFIWRGTREIRQK